jgi:hypothetical protein
VNGGTITGPAAAAFTIDTGGAAGANALNIGGNSSGMSIGRAATTQALLGNATVAGTLAVTGTSSHTGNATFGGTITVTGASSLRGGVTGPVAAATAFTIDNGNASAINIGATTATAVNLGSATIPTAILGNGTVAGTLTVTGATALNGGVTVIGGNLNVGTAASAPAHIIVKQATAPTLTPGAGAGTTGTCSLNSGSDTSGLINVTVSSGSTTFAVVCTITYTAAFPTGQAVSLFPNGQVAAAQAVGERPYVTTDTGHFYITSSGVPMTAGTYSWYYIVIGR